MSIAITAVKLILNLIFAVMKLFPVKDRVSLISRQSDKPFLSGPSGSGKSTITHAVLDSMPGLVFSVSHTTRTPRPGEKDGVDYHFIDRAAFLALRDRQPGGFLEWAEEIGRAHV